MTRLYTPNVGNQALSTELINLLEKACPGGRIYAGWREPGLEQYTYKRLRRTGRDPLATLDQWAERILENVNSSKKWPRERGEDGQRGLHYEISHRRNSPSGLVELGPLRIFSLPKRLTNRSINMYKSILNHRRGYGKEGRIWIEIMKKSDLVVYSPAGDMRPNSLVRDLLNLRIAQKSGAKVAAINHSIEVMDPWLIRLLGEIYRSFEVILVRDQNSVELLEKLQFHLDNIRLAPDTSLLAQKASLGKARAREIIEREHIKPSTVGICALNGKQFDVDAWGKIIHQLRAMGKEVMFISNQMLDDVEFARKLRDLYDVRFLTRQYDYGEYIYILSLLDLIISGRYHTCIFTAIAERPFVPLSLFNEQKMSGIAPLLRYPFHAIGTNYAGWQDRVIDNVNDIYRNYHNIVKQLRESVQSGRKVIKKEIIDLADKHAKNLKTTYS
jgi:polysaccharide pyruvyl transferase WcaK-like protein